MNHETQGEKKSLEPHLLQIHKQPPPHENQQYGANDVESLVNMCLCLGKKKNHA
jgi:hypothetical protein